MSIAETYSQGDSIFIVTKLYEDGNLYDVMKTYPKKQMPEPISKVVFRKILIGLLGLKQRLVIHRDIKLGNILIRNELTEVNVCIADFGIAAMLIDHEDHRRFSMGTEGFTAPEVL